MGYIRSDSLGQFFQRRIATAAPGYVQPVAAPVTTTTTAPPVTMPAFFPTFAGKTTAQIAAEAAAMAAAAAERKAADQSTAQEQAQVSLTTMRTASGGTALRIPVRKVTARAPSEPAAVPVTTMPALVTAAEAEPTAPLVQKAGFGLVASLVVAGVLAFMLFRKKGRRVR